jgi:hypothetical protein
MAKTQVGLAEALRKVRARNSRDARTRRQKKLARRQARKAREKRERTRLRMKEAEHRQLLKMRKALYDMARDLDAILAKEDESDTAQRTIVAAAQTARLLLWHTTP